MTGEVGSARAHGKVILLGEHAVVYGVPALAVGIDRGARANASASRDPAFSIDGRPVAGPEVWQAFQALCVELGAPSVSVTAELEVPAGAGLGSSAALGVAIARAILESLGRPANTESVLAAANAWERVFHGNPSGIEGSPNRYNWFGTTQSGFDVFAQMVHGTTIALSVGFVSMGIAGTIGIVFGALAGYLRGWFDMVLSRLIEVVMCIPPLVLILALLAMVEKLTR